MASRPSVPSYNAGFYSPRRGGNPRYLSLWRGCVGAWCPSLGPTGSRLFDWSLYGNHGTLTNMDAATDWTVSGDGVVLDFDGTNDYVNLGTSTHFSPSPAMSVSAWVFSRVAPSLYDAILGREQSSGWGTGWGLYYTNSTTVRFWINSYSGSYAEVAVPTYGSWCLIVGTWLAGQQPKIWCNRTQGTSFGSSPASHTGTTNSTRIGELGTSSYNHNGYIDDVRLYNRILSPYEIAILATRRGIAYELDYGSDAFGNAAAPPAPTSTSNLLLMGVG